MHGERERIESFVTTGILQAKLLYVLTVSLKIGRLVDRCGWHEALGLRCIPSYCFGRFCFVKKQTVNFGLVCLHSGCCTVPTEQ